MNHDDQNVIADYDTLIREKFRIEQQIAIQKNIVSHDVDELKSQFKKQVKPAIEAAHFVRRISRSETRGNALLNLAANLAVDIAVKRMLRNSNAAVQVVLPRIIKLGLRSLFSLNNQFLQRPKD